MNRMKFYGMFKAFTESLLLTFAEVATPDSFFNRLLSREWDYRSEAAIQRLIRLALLPLQSLSGIRTFYASASKLLEFLKVAKVKGTIETELRKIERCLLLILDDLFFVSFDTKERPILLDIIEDRHERKSIIITSHVPVFNWYDAI